MAGLGEACTHIGAVLFYLEAFTNVNSGVTCTQQECKWVIPERDTILTCQRYRFYICQREEKKKRGQARARVKIEQCYKYDTWPVWAKQFFWEIMQVWNKTCYYIYCRPIFWPVHSKSSATVFSKATTAFLWWKISQMLLYRASGCLWRDWDYTNWANGDCMQLKWKRGLRVSLIYGLHTELEGSLLQEWNLHVAQTLLIPHKP